MILERKENVNKFSFSIFLPIFVGFFVTSSAYHIKEAVKLRRRNGVFWMKEHSAYLQYKESTPLREYVDDGIEVIIPDKAKKSKVKIQWYNIFAIIVRSIFSLGALFTHMAVIRTSDLADINLSLILNLYSLTPFLTAILFFIVFKERLNKLHILGMVFIFSCVIITGESNH